MGKLSKYSILIICEGENTEPLFFKSIRDAILNKTYEIGDCSIIIRPEPEEKNEEKKEVKFSKNKPKFKPRQTKKTKEDKPTEIEGVPPLKWVLAGKEELRNGTFNEVWAVFDHDNHPKRKEAFEAAEEEIHGAKVQIAFSSRSFEYYLLLHFEKIYRQFYETVCNDCAEGKKQEKNQKKKKENVADKSIKSCDGNICINGYAKKQGYWQESKKEESTYLLIKDKLELGFIYSEWLRNESNKYETRVLIYDKNPYVTVDKLVKRLTGYDTYSYEWLFVNDTRKIDEIEIKLLTNKQILITTTTTKTVIVAPNSFSKYLSNNQQESFGDRVVFSETKNKTLVELDLKTNSGFNILFFIFKYKNHIMIIDLG